MTGHHAAAVTAAPSPNRPLIAGNGKEDRTVLHAPQRALVVGCHGGVGRAVLSLLEHTDAGRRLRSRLEALVLADTRGGPEAVNGAVVLPPVTIRSADDLAQIVREHRITQVIALGSLDTVECIETCDALGADFLAASAEEWPGGAPVPTDAVIRRLLPPRAPRASRSHLVGSGANPGLVNALAPIALRTFARRVGVAPHADALDLYAVLVTEEDTTREIGASPSADVFAMTWSPGHCLDELLEPRAFVVSGGRVIGLGHRPVEAAYRARCGARGINGMAVPHEELLTLSRVFPSVEMAFVYRVPHAARRALRKHPERMRPEQWRTHRLYPPWARALRGEDRLGVLLCSRRFGEFWAGFRTDVAEGVALGTNATQLQTAAGVLAGWWQLGRRRGVHFVEDLDVEEFVRFAAGILGWPMAVEDREAPFLPLAERRVPPPSRLRRRAPARVARVAPASRIEHLALG